MGTHPIFESDFDCLTDKCRFELYIDNYVYNPVLTFDLKDIQGCAL